MYIYTHTNLLPTYLPFRVFKSWVVQISPVTNQGTPVQGETSSWWFFHGVISLTYKWWFVTFKHQKCWYNGDIMTGWWCYFTILKNDGVRQWVPDDIPYMKWKIKHVPSHQPSRWTSQLDLPAIAQGFSSYGAAKGHAPVENLWCFCEAYGTNMALQSTCCKTPWNSIVFHPVAIYFPVYPVWKWFRQWKLAESVEIGRHFLTMSLAFRQLLSAYVYFHTTFLTALNSDKCGQILRPREPNNCRCWSRKIRNTWWFNVV